MAEDRQIDVYGGVDTHRDTHVAAVVDTAGRVLGSVSFPADPAGYEKDEKLVGVTRQRCPGRDRGHRQLRRRPDPPPHQHRC